MKNQTTKKPGLASELLALFLGTTLWCSMFFSQARIILLLFILILLGLFATKMLLSYYHSPDMFKTAYKRIKCVILKQPLFTFKPIYEENVHED